MGEKYRVLVTGSAGAIGACVVPALKARGHYVRGFDLKPCEICDESVVGNLTDKAAIDMAMDSMDTLLHLGAEPNDCDFVTRLVPSNIIGVYNVLDCARRRRLRRVILASSMQACNGLFKEGRPLPVKLSDGTCPTNHYGVTKVFAEAIGQMYAARHGLSVLAVRIGWFVRDDDERRRMLNETRWHDVYLSRDDAARFFVASVEAKDIAFSILFAVSKHKNKPVFDIQPARDLIGYIPQDTFTE